MEDPSEDPDPTSVCISSMNKITLPFEAFTSSITPFKRSSNSPRYLAPARRDPMSSAKICLSCKDAGTSEATIREASASITAVLPTPGSPMSTGLFFDLLDKMWMHLRISSSLPMTGSSLPSRASWVKSLAYFWSDSYASSAILESTLRCAGPLTLRIIFIRRSRFAPALPDGKSPPHSAKALAPNRLVSRKSAQRRCSTET
mmetsp:Transcript_29462/g.62532  ORF Transcript_29462/g.62532 Transcript_29462/m.62532 type:complete len:202 (+) Transcript_29462:2592-3197(+)